MARTDEAIVLAGGFGTRLRSVVSDVPKPLAPIRGRPFLCLLLDMLASQGIRRVVLATGYMGDRIAEVLGQRWQGMSLVYSQEQQPLGTGGAIAAGATRIEGETFFVLNGDTYLALDYHAFDAQARDAGALLGMALADVADVARYGAVKVEQGRVRGFVEKGQAGPGHINAGVYRLERGLTAAFPDTPAFSFESMVLVPETERGVVTGYTRTESFIDIGVPEDYARAQHELHVVGDVGR